MEIHVNHKGNVTTIYALKGLCKICALHSTVYADGKVANACADRYGMLSTEVREKLQIRTDFLPRTGTETEIKSVCAECLCVVAEEMKNWIHGRPSNVYQ